MAKCKALMESAAKGLNVAIVYKVCFVKCIYRVRTAVHITTRSVTKKSEVSYITFATRA